MTHQRYREEAKTRLPGRGVDPALAERGQVAARSSVRAAFGRNDEHEIWSWAGEITLDTCNEMMEDVLVNVELAFEVAKHILFYLIHLS